MLNQFKKLLYVGFLGCLLVTTTGCVVLAVGAAAGAGVAYIKGGLEKNFDKPVSRVHQASLAGLKSLKLRVIQDQLTDHRSVIKAEYPDETKVTVDIEALTERSAKIQIRVGVFGDEAKSQMILTAIERRL